MYGATRQRGHGEPMTLPALDQDLVSPHDALLAELEKCRKREKRLHARYAQAVNVGKKNRAKSRLHAYMNSKAVRFVAMASAAKALPLSHRPSLAKCKVLSASLKLHQRIAEVVKVFPKAKSNGDYRAICSFGPMHRAAQWMVRRLLTPHVHFRGWQYEGKRGGINRVAKEIVNLLHQHPKMFAWHGDIQRHYASFDTDKLAQQAPLPKKVTKYVVSGRHMKVVSGTSHTGPIIDTLPLLLAARRGIPQGSAASPLTANWSLSSLKWRTPKGAWLFNWADNFLILGMTEAVVDATAHSLAEAVAKAPGGAFDLIQKQKSSAENGFPFLGYWFRAVNGTVDVWPTVANDTKFGERLEYLQDRARRRSALYASNDGSEQRDAALEAVADYRQYALSWASAFSICDAAPFLIEDVHHYAAKFLNWCGAQPADLEPYNASAEKWQWQGSGG